MFVAMQKLIHKAKPKQYIKDETVKVMIETNELLNRFKRYFKDLYATKSQAHTE